MSDTIKSEVSDREPRQSRRARRRARRLERKLSPTPPDTCPQCGLVDDDQTSTDLLLTGGKRRSFCSPACIVAFARSKEGAAQILWRPFFKASAKVIAHYSRDDCRCVQCEKNSDVQWGKEPEADEEIRRLAEEWEIADKAVYTTLNEGEILRADRLYRRLVSLLGERLPAYRLPFMEISGGYDSAIDGIGMICSIDCLCAFLGYPNEQGTATPIKAAMES